MNDLQITWRNKEQIVNIQIPFMEVKSIFNKYKESKDLHEINQGLNKIFGKLQELQKEMQENIKIKNVANFNKNGLDFNEYFHDQEYKIEETWKELKDIYYSLHWDKHGFNVY